jgi:hypothetical protein
MGIQIVGTIFLEVGLPFLIWVPRWRWAVMCGSVMLHTGIAVFMGLTTFSLIMIIMLASFLPAEVINDLVQRVSERGRQLFTGRSAPARQPGDLVLSES